MMLITYTHAGWFGICPVYVSGIEESESGDAKLHQPQTLDIMPRHPAADCLFDLSEFVLGLWIGLISIIRPDWEPEWPLVITGKLETPVVQKMEEDA